MNDHRMNKKDDYKDLFTYYIVYDYRVKNITVYY